MGRNTLAILITLLCAFTTPGITANAQDLKKLPRVVISSGGPYTSQNNSIQNFDGTIDVPREYVTKPLGLVATNGSLSTPGFSWVRMFLNPGGSDTNLQSGSSELGRLLVDENSFLNSAQIYIDVTSQLAAGRNNVHIEGVGRPGSQFFWELRSIGAPRLNKLNPSVTIAGAPLIVTGVGFSVRPAENEVMLGPMPLSVMESNGTAIKVFVPPGFPEGQYPFFVAIQAQRSNAIPMQVLPSPKITSVTPVRLLPGQTIAIRGSGFANSAQGNRVYIGRYPAPVIGANAQMITAMVPNMPAGEAKITVIANGATAAGNPQVAISYLNR